MKITKNLFIFMATAVACLVSAPVFASNFGLEVNALPHAIMGLLGGITFLLYGLDKMTSAFKSLAGAKLKYVLGSLTKTRVKGLLTGAAVTAVVQSSAATTVMVVGFISAKLMTLPQSLAVILGADIGTTLTVQLIAFKLNQYALIFIILGFIIKNLSKKDSIWHLGRVIMAIGVVFFGIFVIGESMAYLQQLDFVIETIKHISSPIAGILAGFIITALMQSSAAALAIVIAIADQGILSIEAGFYLVLGANVGTCVTAAIASLKSNEDGQRAALAHTFFKFSGATIYLIAFLAAEEWLTKGIMALDAMGESSAEHIMPRQIAHMHTIFNITLALLFLPLTHIVADTLTRIIKKKRKKWRVKAVFLDKYLIDTPSLALNAARNEAAHMVSLVQKLMRQSLPIVISGDIDKLAKLKKQEKDIDALYNQIIKYLGIVSKKNLSRSESLELMWLMGNVNRLENISDLLGDELYEIGAKRQRENIVVSKPTEKKLLTLAEDTNKALRYSSKAITSFETKLAKNADALDKKTYQQKVDKLVIHQAQRLTADEAKRFQTYSIEMDIIDKMQRVFYHSRKMAKETHKFIDQRNHVETDTKDVDTETAAKA